VARSFSVNQPDRSWFASGFELSSSEVMNELLATSEGPGLRGFLRRQQVVVALQPVAMMRLPTWYSAVLPC
jgi:hypothetical protein